MDGEGAGFAAVDGPADSVVGPSDGNTGGAGMRRLVLQLRQVLVTACPWLPDATGHYQP